MTSLEDEVKARADICKSVGEALAHQAWILRLFSRVFLGLGALLGITSALVQLSPALSIYLSFAGGSSAIATSAAFMLIIQTLVPLFIVDPPSRYEDYVLHKISLIDRALAKKTNKTAKQEKLEYVIEITDKNLENVQKKWPRLYRKAIS